MLTKTINQLHFEDLEPHRFEDLIRQLIYNLKDWNSIEATGKLGQDDGIDILGREKINNTQEENDNFIEIERVWNIQCKREKSITPKKMIKIIEESFKSGVPDCYILAAACNFSKKTRDIFREEMIKYKIKEFYIWGKTELEDMLFQEANDYLLFAYFGISIHLKQKKDLFNLRKKIEMKKKLKDLIFGEKYHNGVVIVEVDDMEYITSIDSYFYLGDRFGSNGIEVYKGKYLAYIDEIKKEYDYDKNFNYYKPDNINIEYEYANKSTVEIDKTKKGAVETHFILNYDQIIEIDFIGDFYNEYRPIIYIKDENIIEKEERVELEKEGSYYDIAEFKKIKIY